VRKKIPTTTLAKSESGMSQKKILFIPPAGLARWGARKKARVVIAVRSGILSRFEAYNRYMLSEEELSQWEEAFNRDGIAGLQTKIRSRRRLERGAEPTLHRASRRDVTPDFHPGRTRVRG
jgi:Protein of unknown function (DUF1153)